MHTEKKISGEVPFDGRIFRVERDEIELENGRRSFREVARHKSGGACVLCEVDGKIAFVRQYRYAYGQELLELPAGKLDAGETPAECAVRELREETGLIAGRLIDLGECCPSPGWMIERLHIFAAEDARRGEAALDEGEFLDVVWLERNDALNMVLRNELPDAKTQIALLKWLALEQQNAQ